MNYQELPKLKDSISYLYLEHAILERDENAIVAISKEGRIPIPISCVTCLLLGPGTTVTHAAIRVMAEFGCMVIWCGEGVGRFYASGLGETRSAACLLLGPGTTVTHAAIRVMAEFGCMVIWCGEGVGRFYASGLGETRSAANVLAQAKACMDETAHMAVVREMYAIRFPGVNTKNMTLQQIRGLEGIRVKKAYAQAAQAVGITWKKRTYKKAIRFPGVNTKNMTLQQIRGLEGIRVKKAYAQAAQAVGITWKKRTYKKEDWDAADPINRALSIGNSLLYGVCHAAIVSLGFSPALGFVHTGKQLSFVYDIADLYKTETTIPAAFEVVSQKSDIESFDRDVRMTCRKYFHQTRILSRISEDIFRLLKAVPDQNLNDVGAGKLWNGAEETVEGGYSFSGDIGGTP